MEETSAAPAATTLPAYTSKHFKTWRILAPRRFDVVDGVSVRDEAGWVATDGVRAFGLIDGDDAWTENYDLIGYHFGAIDDGTIGVVRELADGLPSLPIGPNADPNAKVLPVDPADVAYGEAKALVSMFARHGRAAAAAARPADAPAATAPATPPAVDGPK